MNKCVDTSSGPADRCRPASFDLSHTVPLPPFPPSLPSLPSGALSTLQPNSYRDRLNHSTYDSSPRLQIPSGADNAKTNAPITFGNDAGRPQPKWPWLSSSSFPDGGLPVSLPRPALQLPLPLPPQYLFQSPSFASSLPTLPLPPHFPQSSDDTRRMSLSHHSGSPPLSANSGSSQSQLTDGSLVQPPSRRNSELDTMRSRPPTADSRRSSQASVPPMTDMRKNATPDAAVTQPTAATGAKSVQPSPISKLTPAKSRRVRTGCLTCRERHLKCDEGVPDCLNCRKRNRECKRGLRLNFIDIQMKPIPYEPPTSEWHVSFLDESRLIASEYVGGSDRYPLVGEAPAVSSRQDDSELPPKRRRSSGPVGGLMGESRTLSIPAAPRPSTSYAIPHMIPSVFETHNHTRDRMHISSTLTKEKMQSLPSTLGGPSLGGDSVFNLAAIREETSVHPQACRSSDTSSTASSMAFQGRGPPSTTSFRAEVGNSPEGTDSGNVMPHIGVGPGNVAVPEGLPTPPSEKAGLMREIPGFGTVSGFEVPYNDASALNGEEKEYLNTADEILFMQVFVEEVGIWLDSMDKDKHFSRILPFMALKSPMLLNASLACGVKHLTLVNSAYKDDKALFYYDTATTQLLRSLQNPDRNIEECATTAVILNVYEIMSEKPNERMSHIAGARALIRECGWDARSKGVGAACFWVNIGMEVLSCLSFNWPTAWDPDQWGLDLDFANNLDTAEDVKREDKDGKKDYDGAGLIAENNCGDVSLDKLPTEAPTRQLTAMASALTAGGDEEVWVHRIFYIVAKISNFRANIPQFKEPSPHDEQARLQSRFTEWKRLKSLCDSWNRNCSRTMRPFSYLFPSQNSSSTSVFPNVWLIKRAAVIGRLFYHTAMVLLHQVNPIKSPDYPENKNALLHHAHQVCGIVAHAKDRGIASVAIRSLVTAALVLRDRREQDEVVSLLQRISTETGWRISVIFKQLERAWGRVNVVETLAANPTPLSGRNTTSAAVPLSGGNSGGLFSTSTSYQSIHHSSVANSSPGMGFSGPLLTKTPGPNLAPVIPHRKSLLNSLNGTANGSPHHFHMLSTTSVASNTSASAATTAPSSVQSSPAVPTLLPYRPPQMLNPLLRADFNLPDHPYKAFYRPPSDVNPPNTQSF